MKIKWSYEQCMIIYSGGYQVTIVKMIRLKSMSFWAADLKGTMS